MEAKAGKLRHRVSIEAAVRSPDAGGGAERTWVQVASVWAEILPSRGNEALSADRIEGRVTHVLHLRAAFAVEPAMRIRWGERLLDIRAVIDLGERRRWLRVLAEERDL